MNAPNITRRDFSRRALFTAAGASALAVPAIASAAPADAALLRLWEEWKHAYRGVCHMLRMEGLAEPKAWADQDVMIAAGVPRDRAERIGADRHGLTEINEGVERAWEALEDVAADIRETTPEGDMGTAIQLAVVLVFEQDAGGNLYRIVYQRLAESVGRDFLAEADAITALSASTEEGVSC